LLNRSQFRLLAALLMAASMWFYVQGVLIPYQRADAARHNRPRGNLSDLYPRWLGARELLLHHRNPYSPEITREIQEGYYGRPLDPNRPDDPKDQQGFAYPVYVVFLLAPTIHMSFPAVQVGFRWLLVLLAVAAVPLWLYAIRWRPSRGTFVVLLLLALGCFPVVQGIKLQQLSLLVSVFIAAAAALLAGGQLALAGILLALASIKPQLVLPVASWLILWSLSDWRRRWHFLAGFFVTLAMLLAGAEYELPGWMGHFRDAVNAYGQYTGGSRSLLDVLLTPSLGRLFAAVVALAVAYVCWKRKSQPVQTSGFALSLSLVLAATVVVIPMFAPYNQVLLLPAIFLIVRSWDALWRKSAITRVVCVVAAAMVLWPWLAALSLVAGSLFFPAAVIQQGWAAPLYTSLGIPLGVLALFACLVNA
jgi:hypothetical protein